METWIWPEPRKGSERTRLGYLRAGAALALRSTERVIGPGCAGGFVPVRPQGWVCLDRSATLDGGAHYVRAMQHALPSTGPLPLRYALSNGAPMYRRLPTRAEWEATERSLGPAGSFRPQSWGNRGHELLAELRVDPPSAGIPDFLAQGGSVNGPRPLALVRRQLPHGSMLAYTESFEHEGRAFLLSADGTVVPADRVRPFRASSFRGLELPTEARLPLAFFRARPRTRWRQTSAGFEPDGAWPARAHAELDPALEPVGSGAERRLATRERDGSGRPLWVLEQDATVLRAREALPIGVPPGVRWLLVSITQGTLVAYEGLTPTFATLVSPGAGGVPRRGVDPVKSSSTPLGVYRMTFKHRASTMSPEYGEDRSFWIADVPFVQYFAAPFALHVAYWHENFGEPMSAGCINVSPRDGEWLFDFTGPTVPPGWWGASTAAPNTPGTHIVITR